MKNIKMMLPVFKKIVLKNKNKNQIDPYISSTSIKLFIIFFELEFKHFAFNMMREKDSYLNCMT